MSTSRQPGKIFIFNWGMQGLFFIVKVLIGISDSLARARDGSSDNTESRMQASADDTGYVSTTPKSEERYG